MWDFGKQMRVEDEPNRSGYLWHAVERRWMAHWGPDMTEAVKVGTGCHVGEFGEVCDREGRLHIEVDGKRQWRRVQEALPLLRNGGAVAVRKRMPSSCAPTVSGDQLLDENVGE